MKRTTFWLFTAIVSLLIACEKGSDSTDSGPESQWTFNGATYKVKNGSYESSSNDLLANDDPSAAGGGNYVRIMFGSTTKPSTNGTLTVVNFAATSNATNCVIQVGNVNDVSLPVGNLSTGKAGDQVTLSVSAAGKLTATFSNITVSANGGTTTKTVSGTVIEK